MLNYEDKSVSDIAKSVTTYREEQHGRTVYRITDVHKGEIDLAKTIGDLIVKKILMREL